MKRTEEFKIFSELDLEKEFDLIGNQLQDTSNINIESDWNMRIKAFKRMQALVSSDYIGFENFPALFLKFTGPLSVQLNDLRSALVKEAATTIVMAASVLGESFELCAERLAEPLYRLINSGNKLLADTGSECFIEVIKSQVTWRLIPKTLEQFSSKNPNIRTKSCTFLQIMLEQYPCEVFEYAAANKSGFLEKLEQGLKLAVHDASSETRVIARKAFLNYRSLFPARASKLFQNFDGSIQRAFGELTTENRSTTTPVRSTSANANRVHASTTPKIESKSIEKKARNSLNEIRDLSSTGGTTPDSNKPLSSSLTEKKPTPKPPLEQPMRASAKEDPSLENLIASTSDSNWSARILAFEGLKKKVSEESAAKLINNSKLLWEQLVSTHIEHIVETNFKVATAALGTLYAITDMYPEKISLALERMLPKLMICLSDSKETVSEGAMKVLELIIDIYIPEDLLALMLKYTSLELKTTTHVKFVEVLTVLAAGSTEFFNAVTNIRAYIGKILQIMKETNKAFGRNLLYALEISFEKNRNGSVGVAKELPQQELAAIRALMQENASKYEGLIREPVRESAKEVNLKAASQSYEVKKATVQAREETKVQSAVREEPKPVYREEREIKVQSAAREEPKPVYREEREIKVQSAVREEPKPVHREEKESKVQSAARENPKPVHREEKEIIIKPISTSMREEPRPLPMQSKPEALRRAQKLNEDLEDTAFDRAFPEFLAICNECVAENTLGDAVILTLQSALKRHKSTCQKFHHDYISAISKGFYLESRHILQLVEESIEELVGTIPGNASIQALIHQIRSHDVPALQAFIRTLTKTVTNTRPAVLAPLVRSVFSQMKDSLNHGNADVRKSVVFCLVEIQAVIQEEFVSYLEELTPSQQKLVTIYIQRRLSS